MDGQQSDTSGNSERERKNCFETGRQQSDTSGNSEKKEGAASKRPGADCAAELSESGKNMKPKVGRQFRQEKILPESPDKYPVRVITEIPGSSRTFPGTVHLRNICD